MPYHWGPWSSYFWLTCLAMPTKPKRVWHVNLRVNVSELHRRRCHDDDDGDGCATTSVFPELVLPHSTHFRDGLPSWTCCSRDVIFILLDGAHPSVWKRLDFVNIIDNCGNAPDSAICYSPKACEIYSVERTNRWGQINLINLNPRKIWV